MRLSRVVAMVWLAFAALLVAVVPASATVSGPGATAPIETNYQDPVTALAPGSRPPVRHCTVTVMQHDFANSYGAPFTGTVAPPAACPGPWAKVVMDWTGSVAGRQYDRLAGVWLGGAEIFRTSTPEPDPAGISWHVAKDISAFIPLLSKTEPLVADLGNIVDSTYTGVYHMTMTFTYYQAQALPLLPGPGPVPARRPRRPDRAAVGDRRRRGRHQRRLVHAERRAERQRHRDPAPQPDRGH